AAFLSWAGVPLAVRYLSAVPMAFFSVVPPWILVEPLWTPWAWLSQAASSSRSSRALAVLLLGARTL
ncbi:hypothetical protein ACSDR0_50900, partial [Streptosporangium sp. G11]|uniref:hypothetical protein n=1 Tax=Streptosporangium sp. G11 TaxID=3436926 RepID=UPI003EBCB62F